MESDSTVLMLRAVVISIMLHMFILYLLTLFMPRPDERSAYSSLNVYFTSSSDSLSRTDLPKPAEFKEKTVEVPPPQIPVSPPVRKSNPPPEKIPDLVTHDIQVPWDGEAGTPDAEISSVSEPEISISAGTSESDALIDTEGSGSSVLSESSALPAGEADQELNVLWTGLPVRVLKIPEPSFSLPYGGILPREVRVSFEVLSDGTSVSVKIVPPGSGYLNLDQQIRTYVASLLFEPFGDDEQRRKGLLTLNLRHQETSRP